MPYWNALPNSDDVALYLPESPLPRPRNICARTTPALPRAPKTAADATRRASPPILSSVVSESGITAAPNVCRICVPGSSPAPSSSLIFSYSNRNSLYAPVTMRLKSLPVMTSLFPTIKSHPFLFRCSFYYTINARPAPEKIMKKLLATDAENRYDRFVRQS